MKNSILLLLATLGLAGGFAHADDPARVSMTTGLDYSTITDSSDVDTVMWYLPLTVNYEASAGSLRLTIPYLQIDGPATVVDAGSGTFVEDGGGDQTEVESGLGDVVASGSYYLFNGYGAWPMVDLTAKVKFATADEEKGLGSGENDYYLQIDPAKAIGPSTLFGTVGYKVAGDSEAADYNNVYYGSLGMGYRLTARASAGLIYDYRQPTFDDSDEIKELTAYFSRRSADKTNLFAYVVKGYSEASANWAFGTMVSYRFR